MALRTPPAIMTSVHKSDHSCAEIFHIAKQIRVWYIKEIGSKIGLAALVPTVLKII